MASSLDPNVSQTRKGVIASSGHLNERAIRIADKFDKIGADGVRKTLVAQLQMPEDIAAKCVALAQIRTSDLSFIEQVRALGVQSPLLSSCRREMLPFACRRVMPPRSFRISSTT